MLLVLFTLCGPVRLWVRTRRVLRFEFRKGNNRLEAAIISLQEGELLPHRGRCRSRVNLAIGNLPVLYLACTNKAAYHEKNHAQQQKKHISGDSGR
jgi:hypothetical protein